MRGRHDWNFEKVVVQGAGLRYSMLTPAYILAERRCRVCGAADTALYKTQAILQKPKELRV